MFKLLNDITTGKDNTTHEIVRVFMVIVIGIVMAAFAVGTTMEIRHAITTGQWDLQSYYQANLTFILGVGGFLLSGAGAIKIKSTNEPSDPTSQIITTKTFEQTKTAGVTP